MGSTEQRSGRDQKLGEGEAPLDFHPIADIFPMIEGVEFNALVADVREHGLREPIVTLEGAILDGRKRFRACQAAGILYRLEPFRGDDAASFVVSLNLRRRHMDARQLAMAGAPIIGVFEEQAKER